MIDYILVAPPPLLVLFGAFPFLLISWVVLFFLYKRELRLTRFYIREYANSKNSIKGLESALTLVQHQLDRHMNECPKTKAKKPVYDEDEHKAILKARRQTQRWIKQFEQEHQSTDT